MIRLFVVTALTLFLGACWPVREMESGRVRRKVEAYEAANPGKAVTADVLQRFEAEARVEVEEEIRREKAAALEHLAAGGAQAATGAVTSNPVAIGTGAALAVGAILAYFGIGRRVAPPGAAAKKPDAAQKEA
jgi:hypothetical protein